MEVGCEGWKRMFKFRKKDDETMTGLARTIWKRMELIYLSELAQKVFGEQWDENVTKNLTRFWKLLGM